MQPGDHHSSTQKIMGFLSEEIKPASTGLNSCTKVRIEELIESLYSEGNLSLISEWGRSPGVGNGNPPSILTWESQGERSSEAHSPHGLKASDKTGVIECIQAWLYSERWEHQLSISNQLLDHWWLVLYTTGRNWRILPLRNRMATGERITDTDTIGNLPSEKMAHRSITPH